MNEDKIKCDKCGHINYYTRIRTNQRVCKICGNIWRVKDEKDTRNHN